MTIATACFITPFLFLLAGWFVPDSVWRRTLGPLTSSGLVAWALAEQSHLAPAQRLLVSSLWLIYVLKGWALLNRPRQALQAASPVGLLLYAYLWPGLDSRPFERREPDSRWQNVSGRWFVWGFPKMVLGIVGLLVIALRTDVSESARCLAAVGCLLTIVHLGFSDVLSSLLRLAGFKVNRLFDSPLASGSLNDFWTRRWNRPFVEMNRLLFRPLLKPVLGRKATVVALFLLSGALHELAISFPASAGWGGPLLYFAVHGGLMLLEKRWKVELWPVSLRRLWLWFWLLVPLPWLFHPPFRATLISPMLAALKSLPPLSNGHTMLAFALQVAGAGHFLVLVASFQVPSRLGWKEELPRLRPLNRKLMWVYGGYIAAIIALLGTMTLNLIPEMMAGEKGALAIAGLTALFWWSRVAVDAFVFEHADWPEGPEFVIGHTLLTCLFVTLASIYTGLLLFHLALK